ncbi:MAG: CpsD/CapB family tyrosine-protein kinase [Rubellimicrobium sp.]|nr:CpsD/CapB family tyrosine-protein kinase [Rubellimicrobium sp.]
MSDRGRLTGRARLDPGARERILAAAAPAPARSDTPPAGAGPSGMAELRAIILDLQDAGAAADTPADTTPPARDDPAPPPDIEANWARLATIPVDPGRMDDNLVITAARHDPAAGAFDVLRTRMVQAMADRGWRRVGITSPTKGCGKSFTALNLAVTLSRYAGHRAVVLDLDLRAPALARTLGMAAPGPVGDMLRGTVAPLDHLRRFAANALNIGANVALGLNDRVEPYAAELFQTRQMAQVLARIEAELAPDLMLFDLPPALAQDDVIALAPLYDCILMVVGGGATTPREVRESLRRIGEDKPVLGMILNRGEGADGDAYRYAYY